MTVARQSILHSIYEVIAGRAAVYLVCTAIQMWLFNEHSPIDGFACVDLTLFGSFAMSAFFVFGVSLPVNFVVRRVATRL